MQLSICTIVTSSKVVSHLPVQANIQYCLARCVETASYRNESTAFEPQVKSVQTKPTQTATNLSLALPYIVGNIPNKLQLLAHVLIAQRVALGV